MLTSTNLSLKKPENSDNYSISDYNYNTDKIDSEIGLIKNKYAASTTGNDSYVLTFTPAFIAYFAGMNIFLMTDVANTGAATININGLGAKAIKKIVSAGKVALDTGDMLANVNYDLVYDGTDFILLNPTLITANIIKGLAYQGIRMKSDESGVEFGNVMIGEKQVYTSGTNTFVAPKTGIYKITVVGAGGGSGLSGVANGAVNANGGGQGGGGGSSVGYVTLTKGTSYSAVVGSGGAQGTGVGGPSGSERFGASGNSSSFQGISGSGGGGGSSVFQGFGSGGSGGSGSGGSINLTGDDGATTFTSGSLYSMHSGKSPLHPYGFGGQPNSNGYSGLVLIEW